MTQHYSRTRTPVQQIPTRAQIEAARRQAMLEVVTQGEDTGYELEEGKEYYVTNPYTFHSSTRKYGTQPTTKGKVKVVAHYHDQPLRAHHPQLQQLQQPYQAERYTDEVEVLNQAKRKRHIHPLLYLGVGMLAMAALFMLLSSAGTLIQTTKDDIQYGRPRTFQIDFVVGHNDSVANPTHFIAVNLNRHVEVIEQPGGDASKMRVFQITTLFGDGQDLTPITLSFRDVNGDHKPDMLIHIQDQTLVMINDKGTFRPARPGEVKGLV